MIKNLTDFLSQIDQMKIYEADYPVIVKMLSLPENLYVKLLEEILNGQLYFSDLEDIFADESYTNLLTQELTEQDKLLKKLKNLSMFRQLIQGSVEYTNVTNGDMYQKVVFTKTDADRLSVLLNKYLLSPDAVYKVSDGVTVNLNYLRNTFGEDPSVEIQELLSLADKKVSAALYEYFRVDRRDALLYSLMSMKDNDLLKGYKTRLFQMIEAGRLVEKDTLPVYQNPQNGKNYTIINNEEQDFIMPDDILFNAADAIIPINYDDQVLNESDKQFMRINMLSVDEMKKMKSLYTLLIKNELIFKDINSIDYVVDS